VKGRYDLKRSAVALCAAFTATVGVVAAAALTEMSFYVASTVALGGSAFIAFALAVIPVGRMWPGWLLLVTFSMGVATLVVTVPLWVTVISVSGCVCPHGAPDPFGGLISPKMAMAISLIATPLAYFVTALLPSRRERMPHAPVASIEDLSE
jgi:hypothetical protein